MAVMEPQAQDRGIVEGAMVVMGVKSIAGRVELTCSWTVFLAQVF